MRGFIIKLAIGAAGVFILVKFGSIDISVLAVVVERPDLLAVAFLCLLATVPLAALRWRSLLEGLGFAMAFRWTLNTTFVSLFFHTFLPGAYGGDAVRLALAYRATGGGLNRLTFSVLTDRITGLIALLLLGLFMVPALPEAYVSRLEWIAALACGLGIVGLAVVLRSGEWLAGMIGRLPAPVGPTLAYVVREVTGALRAYLARPSVLLLAVVISMVQYALVLTALGVLGHAMRLEGLSPLGYVVAGIWSLVANALPVTPGGLGVGEAAFAHVALAFATPESSGNSFGTIFLAMRVLSVLIGVVGVLPWLLSRVDVHKGIAAMQSCNETPTRLPTAK